MAAALSTVEVQRPRKVPPGKPKRPPPAPPRVSHRAALKRGEGEADSTAAELAAQSKRGDSGGQMSPVGTLPEKGVSGS